MTIVSIQECSAGLYRFRRKYFCYQFKSVALAFIGLGISIFALLKLLILFFHILRFLWMFAGATKFRNEILLLGFHQIP